MRVISFSEARESFKAVLDRVEADADVTSRLNADQLAECFSTELHQANLGVIWERLGI